MLQLHYGGRWKGGAATPESKANTLKGATACVAALRQLDKCSSPSDAGPTRQTQRKRMLTESYCRASTLRGKISIAELHDSP